VLFISAGVNDSDFIIEWVDIDTSFSNHFDDADLIIVEWYTASNNHPYNDVESFVAHSHTNNSYCACSDIDLDIVYSDITHSGDADSFWNTNRSHDICAGYHFRDDSFQSFLRVDINLECCALNVVVSDCHGDL